MTKVEQMRDHAAWARERGYEAIARAWDWIADDYEWAERQKEKRQQQQQQEART